MHPKLKLLLAIQFVIATAFSQEKEITTQELDSLHSASRFFTHSLSNNKGIFAGTESKMQNHEPVILQNNQLQFTTCYDTARRNFVRNDTVILYSNDPFPTSDGKLLVSGQMSSKLTNTISKGFLMKTDYMGNVIWMKTYDSLQHKGYSFINYVKILELQDGSILLAGRTDNDITSNNDLVFTRVTATGNLIWSRVYKCKYWTSGSGSADAYYLAQMKQDPWTGAVFISGDLWSKGRTLIKMDMSNGNITWSKSYEYAWANGDDAFGIHIKQNELLYFGKIGTGNAMINIHRINKLTGDTLGSRSFQNIDTAGTKVAFLGGDPVQVTPNGHYLLGGQTYGFYQYQWNGVTPLYQAAVLELDSNLNFVKAYAFKGTYATSLSYTTVSFFPDGSGLLSMMKFISGYTSDMVYIQFKDGQMLRQRSKHYTNEGIPSENVAVRTNTGGDLMVRLLGDSATGMSRNEFLEIYPSDTASNCFGYDHPYNVIYPFTYTPMAPWHLDLIDSVVFTEVNPKTITAETNTVTRYPGCVQVSFCDTLDLVSPAATVCLGQPVDVVFRKNKECSAHPLINWPANAPVSGSYLNDSTMRFQFTASWSGYITGSLYGCQVIKDSILISALAAPGAVNIGPDTVICPSNTIQLNAHSGYASYLWQNGSTDSLLIVTQPGTYSVKVTDACGGVFYDTVQVAPHPPIPFYAGPDRVKCNNDTLHLQAPAGFTSYSWSNNYNINSLTGQSVVVNPLVDTSYYIKAEKSPGCFAYDTIAIKVYHSQAIHLGNDTSFCSGGSVLLDAGLGFSAYSWNTGAVSSQITVNQPGDYKVIATDNNGCRSYDTLKVLNVWPLPSVSLDHATALCTGDSRTLDAGQYPSYLWQDGSNGRTITISGVGDFYVVVTDSHGCVGSDTVHITQVLPLPSGFLPQDSALCNYGKMILQPTGSFTNYLWNTGATGASITITTPGTYWLDVTDNKTCKGRDSIIIHPKECMVGVYIPTAFSPNGDGRNDIFRAMAFGPVTDFRLTVFNRWGEAVFTTTNPVNGWNGEIGASSQPTGVFAWVCNYSLNGKKTVEKGTVLLVR